MSTRPPPPLSPAPTPPPADISELLNRYLPAGQQQPQRTSPEHVVLSTPSASNPAASPYQRADTRLKNEEAQYLADRACEQVSEPFVAETSYIAERAIHNNSNTSHQVGSPKSTSKYANAYTARSPNTAEFRTRYSDPSMAMPHDDAVQYLRHKVTELERVEEVYTDNVDVFRKQAEVDRREKNGLLTNVSKLRAQLVAVEGTKEQLLNDKDVALSRRDEDCNRKILNMRKSLLLSEQSVGSLRTENEHLQAKANALDIQREECDNLRRQIFQMNQNMTVLAQQNEQLQRALKRKEADVQADLDVYVKQLDLVQAQALTTKKEMDIMAIKMRGQETLQEEIHNLKNQNAELQHAISDVDKEATEMQEKHVQALQEKDDECAREILNVRREAMALEKQVESLQLQNAHLVNKHRPQQIIDEITQLQQEVQTLATELDRKNRQCEALQRAVSRKDEEMDTEAQNATSALEELQARFAHMSGELRTEKVQKDRLEGDLKHLQAHLETARTQNAEMEETLHNKTRELQFHIDTLTHKANRSQNEADTIKALSAAMEEQHRSAVEVMKAQHQRELREALEKKEEHFENTMADYVKQVEIATKLTAATREDNATLSAEVARLGADLVQLEMLKNKVEQQQRVLEDREQEAANDLQTFNSQVEDLTQEISSLRQDRDDARNELQELQAQYGETKRIADAVPALEAEVIATREKVIELTSAAIKNQRHHSDQISNLQQQQQVLEKQLNEAAKAGNGTRELEFAVKNRQLTTENEKLRDLLRDAVEATPAPVKNSPTNNAMNRSGDYEPPRAWQQSPKTDELSQHTPQLSQPGPSQSTKVPPLDLRQSMNNANANPNLMSPQVQYLQRAGSLYDANPRPETPISGGAEPRRPRDVELPDTLLYGREIQYGASGPNSVRYTTLPRLFEDVANLHGEAIALRVERRPDEWDEVDWRHYYLRSFQFAKALVAGGMQPMQGVVLCAQNSYEWMTAYFGALFAGGVPVTCHPSWGPRQYFRIAADCNAHVIVVDSIKTLQKFLTLKEQLVTVKHMVLAKESVPPTLKSLHGDYVLGYEQFMNRAAQAQDMAIADRGDKIFDQHAATVVYTGGTTGEPKGVALSHDALCFTANAVLSSLVPEQPASSIVLGSLGEAYQQVLHLVMPLIHAHQRRTPFTVTVPRASPNLREALRVAKPTFLAAPAFLLDDLVAELHSAPKSEGDAKLAAWASNVSLEACRNRQLMTEAAPVKGAAMALQVNERIRAGVHLDKVTALLVVGGSVPKNVCEAFAQAGIDVLESYGLAEACGFATLSTSFHFRFGSTGLKLPGTELRIAAADDSLRKEGEIVVRGRHTMIGYFGSDVRAFDEGNWLRTGDVGRLDDLSFLHLNGREGDYFVNEGGQRVCPTVVEHGLKSLCPHLSNVFVVGQNRKFPVALVTLKCKRNPDTGAPTDDLVETALEVNPDVLLSTTARRDKKWLDYILGIITEYNAIAPSASHKVRRFTILPSEIAAEEMTPSKKVKRQLVLERCVHSIDRLYKD